jgi:hypothetical protein
MAFKAEAGMTGRGWRFFLVCFCLLGSVGSHAENGDDSNADQRFTLRGFGTLGYARSDNDSAEFVRDLSQPRGLTREWSSSVDSMIALQANLKLGEQTDGVVQLMSRYRYDGSYQPEVSWAFVRHEFSPDLQVRVGRLGTEFYMLSDSRLVGYSNQMVRPPADYYGPLMFSYFDGMDVNVGHSLGTGLLRAKLFAGHSPESFSFVEPVNWSQKGSHVFGGHVDYFVGPWQFRVGHAEIKFGNDAPFDAVPSLALLSGVPEFSLKGRTASFDSLGVVYDRGQLQVQTMFSRIRYQTPLFEDSRAAFIVASYRMEPLTPFIGYSQVKSLTKEIPLTGNFGADATAPVFSSFSHADQHTITVGARWDFRENMALKLQFDRIRGKPESVFPFRGPNPQWDGRMKVLSVALDFTF